MLGTLCDADMGSNHNERYFLVCYKVIGVGSGQVAPSSTSTNYDNGKMATRNPQVTNDQHLVCLCQTLRGLSSSKPLTPLSSSRILAMSSSSLKFWHFEILVLQLCFLELTAFAPRRHFKEDFDTFSVKLSQSEYFFENK